MSESLDLTQVLTKTLLAEIDRRLNEIQVGEKEVLPVQWCHNCQNYKTWEGEPDDVPDDYNCCALGHRMSFRMPEGPTDDEWGYYRTRCKSRILKEGV